MGTGSGVIPICLCLEVQGLQATGIDVSPEALDVARSNSVRHQVVDQTHWVEGDFLEDDLPRMFEEHLSPCSLVTANPPYVEEEEYRNLSPQLRDYEPAVALQSPRSRNDVYTRLAVLAGQLLAPGGMFLMEMSEFGLGDLPEFTSLGPFASVQKKEDHRGVPRILQARKKE